MALVKRYAKLDDWLPTSSKMVLEYLKVKGYDIPKHRKTRKPTADEEALEKLLRKHPDDPVLPKVLEARRIQKGKGYFNDSHLGRDGRLHPEYTRHPETLRPSSRRPNLFNIPQGRKDAEALVAQAIRDTIEASPGFVLIERDYKAEESLLVGFFAGDENYMRMARLGIYTFFLARQLGQTIDMSLPDAEIAKLLKPIKAAHPFEYALWKVIILAKGYGEGFYALAKQLEPFFWEQAKADALAKGKTMVWAANHMQALAKEAARDYSAIYEREAPKVVKWQHDTRMRAHKERKLVNPYGYCVSPETKILTGDLNWVRADCLKTGDSLLAFDENAAEGHRARQYRLGTVEAASPDIAEVAEVTLSNGDKITTTLEHPWLVTQFPSGKGPYVWTETRHLRVGQRALKALPVWHFNDTRDAGWLAGFFDGEGSWSHSGTGGPKSSPSILTAAQLPGPTMMRASKYLQKFAFKHSIGFREDPDRCGHILVNGGFSEHLRFLGSIRPHRLLAKMGTRPLGEVRACEDVRVESIKFLGRGPIVRLQTSTRTYFAEGYAMHNSRQWFDVFSKRRDGTWGPGSEANKVLAFLPQSTGAGILTEACLELDKRYRDHVDFQMLIPLYDSITAECRAGYDAMWQARMREVMEAPIPALGGLVITTEGKTGLSWGSMAECA